MDELCRDLVRPIAEGPDPGPEVEVVDLTVDDRRSGDTNNPDATATQTVPTPTLPSLLSVPPMQDRTPNNAVPTVPVRTENTGFRVKTEDIPLAFGAVSSEVGATDRENVDPPTPSMPNSLSSETVPKVEELSQPGPSRLPLQPWEYIILARDEEHAPIEDLLNCLAVEELQSLVKLLKVKCASKKVS